MNADYNKLYFPELVTYSFEHQQEHFWRCRYTSSEAVSLYYKILLSLELKPVSIEPERIAGTNDLYAIGCYQTISGSEYPFVEVDVVYEHINNDIDASDWLDNVLFSLGEMVVHRKDYYSVSGKYSDVLTSHEFGDDQVISRIRVFKNYDFEHKGAILNH